METTDELRYYYIAVCDEVNDGTPGCLTLADLDPIYVERAIRYADAMGLPHPGVGSLDNLADVEGWFR
jgi:hypothetical protein